MAQISNNPILLHQIDAGTKGRKKGHSYENELALRINTAIMPYSKSNDEHKVVHNGNPANILLDTVLDFFGWSKMDKVEAYATGKLATSEDGDKEILIEGKSITSTKSDVVLVLHNSDEKRIVGVSVKQCNKKNPTNAQVYLTTASSFYNMVKDNGIPVTNKALRAMQQFCGDTGFRPLDDFDCSQRVSSPERYFWEEIDPEGKAEWEKIFNSYQDEVTRLILQKAYPDDPFPPEIILHKTRKADSFDNQEVAVLTMDQFIKLSRKYLSFVCGNYRVKKGRYKEPKSVSHQAPRFGVIQMQRGGQKQHPTELQFNLKAGYFYDLDNL
jgi:hypothetical protein